MCTVLEVQTPGERMADPDLQSTRTKIKAEGEG